MKTLLLLSVAALAAIVPAHAQERTAAGSLDNQMTWSALSGVAKAAADKADAVNARVDQVVVCGKTGKIYSPGATGADSAGCVSAITDMTLVNNIAACNSQKKFYVSATHTCEGGSDGSDRWVAFKSFSSGWIESTKSSAAYNNAVQQATSAGITRMCGANDVATRRCETKGATCYTVGTQQKFENTRGDDSDWQHTYHMGTANAIICD